MTSMKMRNAGLSLLAVLVLGVATTATSAQDQRGEKRHDRPDRVQRTDRAERADRSEPPLRTERQDGRGDRDGRDRREGRDARDDRDRRWWDGAHGHNRHYPVPGRILVPPPRPPAVVWWGGIDYRYWDGVWATSGPRGWISVRPPLGIVVHDLPSWRTAVVIGGLTYLYVNGVYYRERGVGGYEVVPPPAPLPDAQPPERSFVYPSQGQSAEQQASDEYECHRWAVTQSGFDPSGAATGQTPSVSTTGRGDYQRARAACLEGRGYTVR